MSTQRGNDRLITVHAPFLVLDEMKAEQRLIIKKIARKDVFGQLLTGYGKSLTFQLLPGVLSCLKA